MGVTELAASDILKINKIINKDLKKKKNKKKRKEKADRKLFTPL